MAKNPRVFDTQALYEDMKTARGQVLPSSPPTGDTGISDQNRAHLAHIYGSDRLGLEAAINRATNPQATEQIRGMNQRAAQRMGDGEVGYNGNPGRLRQDLQTYGTYDPATNSTRILNGPHPGGHFEFPGDFGANLRDPINGPAPTPSPTPARQALPTVEHDPANSPVSPPTFPASEGARPLGFQPGEYRTRELTPSTRSMPLELQPRLPGWEGADMPRMAGWADREDPMTGLDPRDRPHMTTYADPSAPWSPRRQPPPSPLTPPPPVPDYGSMYQRSLKSGRQVGALTFPQVPKSPYADMSVADLRQGEPPGNPARPQVRPASGVSVPPVPYVAEPPQAGDPYAAREYPGAPLDGSAFNAHDFIRTREESSLIPGLITDPIMNELLATMLA
jgi:hypothetical protein